MSFYSDIIKLILDGEIKSKDELHRAKIRLCKKYGLGDIPSDSDILANIGDDLSDSEVELVVSVVRRKPMRTASGVAVVAVMTSPAECPHGCCIPCPGGPMVCTPQSYTGFEPAAMRASLNNFDPYLQTKNRLEQLKAIGHPVDKIDLIVMGGTFTARNLFYQEWFVRRCFDALNGLDSKNLHEAKKKNEKASCRCIGLTVETRPDWFRLQHAEQILNFGATRLELGVQTVYDDVLYGINRGHTVTDSVLATRIAKNCGLKIVYHMMPGLPGVDEKRDIDCFDEIFSNPCFKPDMLKIYPTLTVEGTRLFDMWKNGDYMPLSTVKAVDLVSKLKTLVPEWVRIQRIQRDIPSDHIDAGVDKSNLRQLVQHYMKQKNLSCRCIRCRELGHKKLKDDFSLNPDDVTMDLTFYNASESEEVFIQLVDKAHDALIGFLRLRDINLSHRWELEKNPCMVIRELKVVGQELSIGEKNKHALQHQGFGKELLSEAERVCVEEYDKKHLFVLSGVGVRPYYKKQGFDPEGVYMLKKLK
jgi:elongator complex protein 3